MSTESPEYVECAHVSVPQDDNFTDRKRLVICCDGTWNNSNNGGVPTNVSRLSAAVAHKCCTGMAQVVYYHRGPGTEEDKWASIMGGLLGLGVTQDIVDCYRFICDNYNPGDEIIIVGFSRGAFTARSIASMVCALGFLNRSGLNNLGLIYQDYKAFNQWTDSRMYNPKEHLLGFNEDQLKMKLEKEYMEEIEAVEDELCEADDLSEDKVWELDNKLNALLEEYEEALNHKNLEQRLEKDKKELFEKMTQMKRADGSMKFRLMAEAYRQQLSEQIGEKVWHEAVEGKVNAVGVWETVGSLGIPKVPWGFWQGSRSAEELRFASYNIHPNIDHAFHALALDEFRTPFSPTLWRRKSSNTHTQLRQVWFPGCHSNVGGGSDSQQISKIALAWMADQLTSVGVEFSNCEMKRILSTISHGDEIRPWGLGKIFSPTSLLTTGPDLAWNTIKAPYLAYHGQFAESSARTPACYTDDNGEKLLTNTEELVHPCVRVRYLYHGLGLDDKSEWRCNALSGHGWNLSVDKVKTPIKVRQGRDPRIVDKYKTVAGSVTAVHQQYPKTQAVGGKLVKTEQPSESDLKQLKTPKNTWTWTHPNGKVLGEEQIGMWERMYIDINDDLVRLKAKSEHVKMQRRTPGDRLRDLATSKVYNALGTAEWVVQTSIGAFVGAPPAKKYPIGYPMKHGYHDFVSWQKGLKDGPPEVDTSAATDFHSAKDDQVHVHYHWMNDGTQ
ncbi:hypothetical protein CORC01_13740 [Colletotrichum orchidophilum]|uniref:T6SS Phospholipase effector Tle1-like catalytic domain-containing protein n=1 Tax=Colletotrichum orchidophilum TaxID=1209926 RepID=A0A1G4APH6_9PEZI|nr:uncharacterized protein CORC01_13740 [Colletotrichum orchidophilum]OHE90963.1 hypothetical protein CORC01_13740 [Colletotrichum orchidophilum]